MAKLRALVADADAELLSLLGKALRQFGADVLAVSSGGALLESLASDRAFDVVVTDISMPWMTGLQVLHSARWARSPIPVVLMTALRDPSLRDQASAHGACAELLHKPFSIEELYGAVRRCVGELGGSQSSC